MEFTVEFYETNDGRCPLRDFLDELKVSDPNDFASVMAGIAKLRNRHTIVSRSPRHSATAFLNYDTSANSIPG